MVHGDRAAAYTQSWDEFGTKVEGEQRQCCHCQYLWDYKPGSGARRGWCFKHDGFLCGRPECQADQDRMLGTVLQQEGKAYSCIAFEEYNDFLAKHNINMIPKIEPGYKLLESGLIVPGSTPGSTPGGA